MERALNQKESMPWYGPRSMAAPPGCRFQPNLERWELMAPDSSTPRSKCEETALAAQLGFGVAAMILRHPLHEGDGRVVVGSSGGLCCDH
jgi:hypothetical protein